MASSSALDAAKAAVAHELGSHFGRTEAVAVAVINAYFGAQSPTSEVVARLLEPVDWAHFVNDDHAADYQAERAEAAALISSLVAEMDSLEAWFDGLTPNEMHDSITRLKDRALTAERLLAEARALSEALNVTDEELVRINNMCVGHDGDVKIWAKMLHKLAVFALATRVSIGGANG